MPTMNPGQGGMMGAFPPAPAAPAMMQAQAPAQQAQGGGIRSWLGNNSEALAAMSKGLLSGRTGSEQFAQGFGGFVDARAAGKKKTRTMEFLQQQDPLTAQAVELGLLTGPEAFKAIYDAKNKPTEFQQRAQAAQQYGIDPNSPEGRAFVLTGKMGGKDGDASYGKTPVYGTDPETGETVLGVVADNGTFKRLDTGNFKPSSGIDKIDAGTHYILIDKRSGQQVGTAPKENYQEAFDTGRGGVEGKAAGEATVSHKSLTSKMAGLEKVVSELEGLADQATYTIAGRALDEGRTQLGMPPREAAVARTKYIAMVDNQVLPMLRDTFGAAFTVEEGKSLRATLGDPNKTAEERKAILRAFIEQKRRNIEAAGIESGQSQPQAQAPGVQSYRDYFGGN